MSNTINQDQELLLRMRSDDEVALKSIFSDYYKLLVTIGYRYTRDEHQSKDIAQEVIVDLWKRRKDIRIKYSLKAFLTRAVINKSLNHLKKKDKVVGIHDFNQVGITTDNAEQSLLYEEVLENIQKAIDNLPPKCKEVFTLSRYHDLSHAQISEKLNISKKTVENHMTRALSELRVTLKKYGVIPLFIIWIKSFFT